MFQRLRLIALVAAVLCGQWLTLAHASEHPALGAHEAVCAYCVSGIGSAPKSEAPAAPGITTVPAPAPRALTNRASTASRPSHGIRGPPNLSI